jgi:hypothetical protein
MRPISKVAPEWWDYTTLSRDILDDAARLGVDDLLQLSRPGFMVKFYNTLEDFYLAEALEYITAWRQATESHPAGICGPVGPVQFLPPRNWHLRGGDALILEGEKVVKQKRAFAIAAHPDDIEFQIAGTLILFS